MTHTQCGRASHGDPELDTDRRRAIVGALRAPRVEGRGTTNRILRQDTSGCYLQMVTPTRKHLTRYAYVTQPMSATSALRTNVGSRRLFEKVFMFRKLHTEKTHWTKQNQMCRTFVASQKAQFTKRNEQFICTTHILKDKLAIDDSRDVYEYIYMCIDVYVYVFFESMYEVGRRVAFTFPILIDRPNDASQLRVFPVRAVVPTRNTRTQPDIHTYICHI